MVVLAFNPSTLEAEGNETQVQGQPSQPGLYTEILSQETFFIYTK